MGKFGNIIGFHGINKLTSQVQHQHQNKGKGYLAFGKIRKRGQQYHHKNNTGSAQKRCFEKKHIENSGNKGCNKHHHQKGTGTVIFLQHGANKKYHGKIADQMSPVCVACHIGNKAYPIPETCRGKAAPAGNGKPALNKSMRNRSGKEQYQGAQQRKTQYRGRIVFYPHCLLVPEKREKSNLAAKTGGRGRREGKKIWRVRLHSP